MNSPVATLVCAHDMSQSLVCAFFRLGRLMMKVGKANLTASTAAGLALCLLPAMMAQESAARKWETFADGSAGQITEFAGIDGTIIPAYVRKPAGQGPFPVVMLIHRHTYSKEATDELGRSTQHPVTDFLAAGWAIYSLDFRPNPPVTLDPREWDDAVRAVQTAARLPFIDAGRVAVFSGGHGANTWARVISRVDVRAAVLCAPAVLDLIEVSHAIARHEAVFPQLPQMISKLEQQSGVTIDRIEKDPAKYHYESALTEAASVRCPVLIIQGRKDMGSPISVVDIYVARLRAAGKHAETYIPDSGTHAFYSGYPTATPETAVAASRAVAFIRKCFDAAR
jgi:dipeptidyl aminopeptidase/acylaminoacyl peptidase